MKFVTIKNETTLADLSREVFESEGVKAAKAAKNAQAALRDANPHIAELKKLPAGTLVLVPDLPGMKEAPVESVGSVSAEMLKHLKRALVGAKAMIEKSAEAQLENAEATVSLSKDRELAALAKQTPELRERLSRVVERAKTQAKEVADNKKAQIQAISQLEKDLASLSPG